MKNIIKYSEFESENKNYELSPNFLEQCRDGTPRFGSDFVNKFVLVIPVIAQLTVPAGESVACLAKKGQLLVRMNNTK